MFRIAAVLLLAGLTLAGCVSDGPQLGADGRPLPKAYIIKKGDEARVTYSLVDSVNALRQAARAQPVTLNPLLTAAAATHSHDMAVQNRPWHFGSDGSSPIERVRRTGYPGMMLGENISETYETELETLSAWMGSPDTRAVILDPAARDIGFAWYQEPNGKIWWTVVTGG